MVFLHAGFMRSLRDAGIAAALAATSTSSVPASSSAVTVTTAGETMSSATVANTTVSPSTTTQLRVSSQQQTAATNNNNNNEGLDRGIGDGGQEGHVPLPKIQEKYFSGNYHVKLGHFSGKYCVKFGNFVFTVRTLHSNVANRRIWDQCKKKYILRTDRRPTGDQPATDRWPTERRPRIWENSKGQRVSDPLHVWFYGWVFGVGGSNVLFPVWPNSWVVLLSSLSQSICYAGVVIVL